MQKIKSLTDVIVSAIIEGKKKRKLLKAKNLD